MANSARSRRICWHLALVVRPCSAPGSAATWFLQTLCAAVTVSSALRCGSDPCASQWNCQSARASVAVAIFSH
eukprot:751683-Alexandrium_andersonii.AAC.1